MNTVPCPSCGESCKPRLWHYTPAFGAVRYMKTQHICTLCGIAMYETGGQINVFGKFAGAFFLGLAGCVALSVSGVAAGGVLIGLLIAAVINAVVFYGGYKVFRVIFPKASKK